MIPQMPDDEKPKFEKEWRDLPDARIEAEIERYLPDTDHRSILLGILEQRRRAADEPEQRRHQQLIRVSLITAAIMLAAASCACKFASSHLAGANITRVSANTTRVASSHLASANTRRVSANTRRLAGSHLATANTRAVIGAAAVAQPASPACRRSHPPESAAGHPNRAARTQPTSRKTMTNPPPTNQRRSGTTVPLETGTKSSSIAMSL
jgi:hypothetical protein